MGAAAAATIATWQTAANPLNPLRLNNHRLVFVPLDLPANVQILQLQDNELVEIPEDLPDSIHTLDITHNKLTALPHTLPISLYTLFAGFNRITALPSNPLCTSLPTSLHTLSLQCNQLTALPNLQPLVQLTLLVLSRNCLTALPPLPSSLKHLRLDNNWFTTFPTLPDTIEEVWIDHNRITELTGDLPAHLTRLNVSFNDIRRISHLAFHPEIQVLMDNNPLPIAYNRHAESFYSYLVRLTACLQQELHSWY
jgi:Leucine-rich repeat (LRR) protein